MAALRSTKARAHYEGGNPCNIFLNAKLRTSRIVRIMASAEMMERHMFCSQVGNEYLMTSMGRYWGILCGTWQETFHFCFRQGSQLDPPDYIIPQCTFACMCPKTELNTNLLQPTADIKGPGKTTTIEARVQRWKILAWSNAGDFVAVQLAWKCFRDPDLFLRTKKYLLGLAQKEPLYRSIQSNQMLRLFILSC